MIIECHMIFIKNLAESFNENSDESLVIFHFDLAAENHYDNIDQNSCNAVESYFSFF